MRQQRNIAKQLAAAACTAALAMSVLAGCGQQAGSASSASGADASSTTETTSAEVTSSSDSSEGTGSGWANMANPWSMADSADAAAQGAGMDGFGVPGALSVGGVDYANPTYFYMDGMAQVTYMSDSGYAVLRKSNQYEGVQDLAGLYYDFSEAWTQNYKGLEIECHGQAPNEAQVAMWSFAGNHYALSISSDDSSELLPMTSDDISGIVSGIQ